MAERCGFGGIFGDNCAILFFILVFLLLFYCPYFFGGIGGCGFGYKE